MIDMHIGTTGPELSDLRDGR